MDSLTDPQIWIALATLTFLEIVLGVDNIIFISILSGKLPADQQAEGAAARAARRDGHARPAAVLAGLDHPADRAVVHRPRPGDLRPRSDPDPRRPVPARQEHLRDPRQARRRGGARVGACAGVVRQRDRPDHAARHRVLARLGHHRRRHGRRAVGDDRGGDDRRRHHDGLGRDRSARSCTSTRPSRCWRSASCC